MLRRNNYNILTVLFSISILFITLLTLPNIDKKLPDPYFHIKITPIVYWIGFMILIVFTLNIIFMKKDTDVALKIGIFFILTLSIFIYYVPKHFYTNSFYGDIYIFIGEVFYTLRHGFFGYGHSKETPGLALMASSLSLITNINYLKIIDIIEIIIPLFLIYLIYMIGKLFTDNRTSILSCFIFMSMYWNGLYFNRQSFALVIQMFMYYVILKFYLIPALINKYFIFILSLMYVTMVITHPLSSLLIPLMLIFFIIIIYLSTYIDFRNKKLQNISDLNIRNLMMRAILLSTIFIMIWSSWHMYTQTNVEYLIRTIQETIQALITRPNPITPIMSFVSGYTELYYPLVYMRTAIYLYELVIGLLLSIFIMKNMRDKLNSSILVSWFFSCWFISPTGLYTGHFLNRSFFHSLPPFSFILSLFCFSKFSQDKANNGDKYFIKNIKRILLIFSVVLMFLIPLLMFCVSPFFYPPITYMEEMDYVSKFGLGYVPIIYSDSVIGYKILQNNASDIIIKFKYGASTMINYKTVVTTYRAYTTKGFSVQSPSLQENILKMEKGIEGNNIFARVYDSDHWHRIHVNQNYRKEI